MSVDMPTAIKKLFPKGTKVTWIQEFSDGYSVEIYSGNWTVYWVERLSKGVFVAQVVGRERVSPVPYWD